MFSPDRCPASANCPSSKPHRLLDVCHDDVVQTFPYFPDASGCSGRGPVSLSAGRPSQGPGSDSLVTRCDRAAWPRQRVCLCVSVFDNRAPHPASAASEIQRTPTSAQPIYLQSHPSPNTIQQNYYLERRSPCTKGRIAQRAAERGATAECAVW